MADLRDAASTPDTPFPGLTPRMALFALLGTLAYLGLAIWGWGGFSAFFANPARVALALVLFALAGASLLTKGNLSPGIAEDRENRWVIAALGTIGLVSGFVPAYTDRVGLLTLDGDGMRWLGVILFALGGALRIWPVFVLGRRFSGLVAIQKDHELVTNGIYAVIRHPSYLGLLISALGWALAFRSLIGVGLALLLVPPVIARIRSEERLLAAHFGAAYEAYRDATPWRLVPHLY